MACRHPRVRAAEGVLLELARSVVCLRGSGLGKRVCLDQQTVLRVPLPPHPVLRFLECDLQADVQAHFQTAHQVPNRR